MAAPKHSPEYVQKICEIVYRDLLAQAAGGSAEWSRGEADRMVAKHGDGGAKFSRYAEQYAQTVRATLRAIEVVGNG